MEVSRMSFLAGGGLSNNWIDVGLFEQELGKEKGPQSYLRTGQNW